DDPCTWAGGFPLTMPKGASMYEAAWRFMSFYAGYQGQKILATGISRIPTNLETLADPEGWNQDIRFFAELLGVAQSRPPLPVGTKLWDAMMTMQESLNQASDTPENLVKEAQAYVDPTMQQFCPFQLPANFGEPDPNLRLPDCAGQAARGPVPDPSCGAPPSRRAANHPRDREEECPHHYASPHCRPGTSTPRSTPAKR